MMQVVLAWHSFWLGAELWQQSASCVVFTSTATCQQTCERCLIMFDHGVQGTFTLQECIRIRRQYIIMYI